MRIVVISDTHIPHTVQALPQALLEDIKKSDSILHAGDFVEIDFLRQLQKMKPVIGVAGNMDSPDILRELPKKKVIELSNFKIGLIHGWGPPYRTLELIKVEFEQEKDLSCIIYGHTHKADICTVGGVIYFNPGSPTDNVFAEYNSYGILEITDKLVPHIIRI